jgi:ribonucleoside-diphosphate reductase alpha chain
MSKEGSTVSGLMDCFATSVSLALQYGVPLKVLCQKFSHTRFAPSGFSGNPEIGYAKSLMDYMFRWLALKYLPKEAIPDEDAGIAEGKPTTGSVGPPSVPSNSSVRHDVVVPHA